MTFGLFWKFPAGAFHTVKLLCNNLNTPGGKASCFPRSAWDLLLRSFTCSPKRIMFLGRMISLPSPRYRKRPVCDSHMPVGGSLPALASDCMKLCFLSLRALLWRRTEWESMYYKSLGKRSTWLSGHPQSYTHTLLVVPMSRETVPLAANLKQTLVGNSWILPGWGTGLPPLPPLQNPTAKTTGRQMPQCSNAQVLTPSLHPPPSHPLRLQQWTLLSLLH